MKETNTFFGTLCISKTDPACILLPFKIAYLFATQTTTEQHSADE